MSIPDDTPFLENPATRAQRLLDPTYISSVLMKHAERSKFDDQLREALRAGEPQQPVVPHPPSQTRPPPVPAARPGKPSDVLDALMRVPAVKSGIETVKSKLNGDWKQLTIGGKATLISHSIVMSGAAVAGVLASDSGRTELYKLLQNKEIPMPIPGVPGLKLQLKTGNEHKAVIMFDIAEFLRSR